MDKLAEKDAPAPERRSARRRLVQSTLYPQKSPEIESNGGEDKADKDCEVEGDNEEDPENCCGSQGKKTRKRKGKGTPPATKASKKVKDKSPSSITPKKKGKSPKSITPKKNGIGNGKASSNSMEREEASPPIPNLRLEAKLTAEENSRIFAGKQVHPFFSSWKSGKRNQEMTEVDNNCCSFERKDKRITLGPVHVFDRIQDEVVSIDWGNWMFYEKTLTSTNCLKRAISSAFEGSVESLKFDKLLCDLHLYDASLPQDKESSDHCHIQQELIEASPEVSVALVDNQEACRQLLDLSYEEHQPFKGRFPEHADYVRKSYAEEKSGILPARKTSYCNGCGNQSDDSLWTDKYRPKNAMEVCGNKESVKFMSEWLHLWSQRGSRANKDYLVSDKCIMQDDSHDYVDSDSENIDEGGGMKNVLLVTGPVGSGKSAAIHACAIEKGFKVLENNASDCRLGAVVKQKFGGALESHCLARSLGNPLDLQNKTTMESVEMLSNGEVVHQVDDEVIEVIHTSETEISNEVISTSGKFVCKDRTVNDRNDVKPLILFEDVDLFFPEDRGFIAAIQQIAEKAKGPVILTSNSNNIILPDNLDRLEVSFTMPSPKDLLSHLHMICAAEKVDIQHHLLEQLIGCCQADIRKTIMHLQFWCQNKRDGKGKRMQKACGPMFFDAEAGHHILPKIISWDFPSQLSELVEKEIARSLSLMEENSILVEVVDGEGHKEMFSSQDMHNNETDTIEAKKESMLRRNCSVQTSDEFADPLITACEFSCFPGTPVSLSRRNFRRKVNIVSSSDSEDDLFCDRSLIIADGDTNKELILEDCSRLPSHFSNAQNCMNPLTNNLLHLEAEKLEENHYQCPEIANDVYLNGTCKSVDISCVPESSFVPETEIDNGAELISGTVCSGCVAETVEISVGNGFDLNIAPVEVDNESALMLHRNSDMLENICDIMEPSQREEVEDSQNENLEALSQGYQVMDECSRIDFMKISKPIGKLNSCVAGNLVTESWKKLRGGNAELKRYATLEKADAFQIVKLANGMCKLISEADLLVSKCQTLDFLELSMFPYEESDAFIWCDEHLQMTSTIAQHGFCSYIKHASTIGSNLGSNKMKHLTWDMLSCTNNMKAFGKSIGQDVDANRILHAGSGLEMNPPKSETLLESEVKANLFDTIKSIVPKRYCLALKGDAFHEYLSSLGCISRSETSRLSKVINTTKKRRVRGARHYLSTGALSLTPEDISLLGQSNIYGKNSSQPNDDSQ